MKGKKLLCLALGMTLLLAVGCNRDGNESIPDAVQPSYEVVTADLGQSAEYGGMTLTVLAAEDPDITMDSGKKAMFFKVKIENGTDETVDASYLNNFTLTLNGTYYEAYECCTMPVMRKLYDYYGEQALNTELAAGESCTGYVACEVDKKYDLIDLHYIPKTTDRNSMITVSMTGNDVVEASK